MFCLDYAILVSSWKVFGRLISQINLFQFILVPSPLSFFPFPLCLPFHLCLPSSCPSLFISCLYPLSSPLSSFIPSHHILLYFILILWNCLHISTYVSPTSPQLKHFHFLLIYISDERLTTLYSLTPFRALSDYLTLLCAFYNSQRAQSRQNIPCNTEAKFCDP